MCAYEICCSTRWKTHSEVQRVGESRSLETFFRHLRKDSGWSGEWTNVCACNKCFKCYQLRDAQCQPNGTKNLPDHLKRCIGSSPAAQVQLNLSQRMMQKSKLSKVDMALLKRKQVHYCVEGYNSFRSVEHDRLLLVKAILYIKGSNLRMSALDLPINAPLCLL